MPKKETMFCCVLTGLYGAQEVKDASHTTEILIGVIIPCVGIIIIVVFVLLWRRRQLEKHARKTQEPSVLYSNAGVTIVSDF